MYDDEGKEVAAEDDEGKGRRRTRVRVMGRRRRRNVSATRGRGGGEMAMMKGCGGRQDGGQNPNLSDEMKP
jgi:hypothetical protein